MYTRIHQPISFLSWASALDLHKVSALGSRVGWTPIRDYERTNEWTNVSCYRSNAVEQKNAADQPDGVDSEVIDSLRAALDLERSTAQQLTESLQQEQERVAHLTAELSRLSEQFTAERYLTVQLKNNMDSMVVNHLLQVFCFVACSS